MARVIRRQIRKCHLHLHWGNIVETSAMHMELFSVTTRILETNATEQMATTTVSTNTSITQDNQIYKLCNTTLQQTLIIIIYNIISKTMFMVLSS